VYLKRRLLILPPLTVPTLSTLAKDSWYLPTSNPVHFLNIANKMQVPHCPVVLHKALPQVLASFIPLQPVSRNIGERDFEPPKPSIGVIVSQQH
jgi:hypothetical protein